MSEKNQPRLTVEALRYHVPIFQRADEAYEAYLERLQAGEAVRVQAEMAFTERELTVDRLIKLSEPLIVREINTIISKSHLRGSEENIFNQVFYAGRAGAVKGLRHFDVNKLEASATNYLIQWFMAYAKKEILAIEAAPYGIPPSRFQIYKKISAVRKKLTEQLGRYASNDEVLAFLHSGKADVKSMAGKKGASNKRYASNQKITPEQVAEQEYFEKNLISQNLIDPLDKQMSEIVFSSKSEKIFEETPFGAFADEHELTDQAIVAIKHELQVELTIEEIAILEAMPAAVLRKLNSQWKLLIRDVNGPFYEFLLRAQHMGFDEFDIVRAIKSIDDGVDTIKPAQWKQLFKVQEKK